MEHRIRVDAGENEKFASTAFDCMIGDHIPVNVRKEDGVGPVIIETIGMITAAEVAEDGSYAMVTVEY